MKSEAQVALRALLQQQSIAALGTLHRGEPHVSMVPYALDAAAPRLLIHVSALAAHTRDMTLHPRVSVLVIAPEGDELPQARARVTIQADAQPLAAGAEEYEAAKAIYLERFAHAAEIFTLADFSLFEIRPLSVRYIAGFAQATSLTADSFARALREV